MKEKLKLILTNLLLDVEKIQEDQNKEGYSSLNEIDALKVLQSLQVHQIELEMQNDELKRINSDYEIAKLKYMNLYEFAPVSYFTLDSDSTIKQVNLSGAMLFGVNRSELIGKRFDLFTSLDDRANFRDMIFRVFLNHTKEITDISLSIRSTPKKYLHLEASLPPDTEDCLVTATDISERVQYEKSLSESELKYRLISDNSTDVIWVYNLTKKSFFYVSPSIFNLRGYTVEEALNEKLEDKISMESSPDQINLMKSRVDDLIKNPMESHEYLDEVQQTCKNGDLIWVEMTSKYYFNSDGEIEVTGVSRNIELRKIAEEKMFYCSYHDQLTGLYNRRFYEEELKRIDIEKNLPIALIMIDVNGLKLTNDIFGHKAGDFVLKSIAKVFKSECKADEIVARIGGDEFIILLPSADLSYSNKLIVRINEAITKLENKNTVISASFGLAIKQNISQSLDIVFKEAEDNMYRHKLSESSRVRSKTIDLIIRKLFEKSNQEMDHSKRVSQLSKMIALSLKLEPEAVNRIELAGLMHDIVKIGVSENIINKTDKLAGAEGYNIIENSEVDYRILSSVKEFSEISDLVLEHQEKWDGTGYPKGLKGEEISIEARIISLANSYDAMIYGRTYKKKLSKNEAIAEIRKYSGSQFDPLLSEVFVEYLLKED